MVARVGADGESPAARTGVADAAITDTVNGSCSAPACRATRLATSNMSEKRKISAARHPS
ncbi:hypothetical protein P9209_26670 [Prescottella defluvii]|nr:hypothetical protein P9209_26670 [Prescottella defluvii]